MILNFDKDLATGYTSPSQIARVLTEHWVNGQVFCPNCGRLKIEKYPNNQPVADFYCSNCKEDYELKGKRNYIGTKVVDGAYRTMMERLRSNNNPNLFLLSYDPQDLCVIDFFVIPKHFFIPDIIEERKPLSPTAQRPNWIGSNIILQRIPQTGKIFLVRNQHIVPRNSVLSQWQKTLFLRYEKEISAKGWLIDVMSSVDKLGKREFTLDDMYSFESELSELHPENKHIKEKIRQQLQILRDKGYLDFVSKGLYRMAEDKL